jgi:hypothetical protein
VRRTAKTHPKNNTGWSAFNKIAADPRVELVFSESHRDDVDVWVRLVKPYEFEELNSLHACSDTYYGIEEVNGRMLDADSSEADKVKIVKEKLESDLSCVEVG